MTDSVGRSTRIVGAVPRRTGQSAGRSDAFKAVRSKVASFKESTRASASDRPSATRR